MATAQFPSNSELAEYLKPPPELQGEDGHPLSETLPSMNIENINKSTLTTESNVDSTDDEQVSQSGTSVDTCPTPNLNRLAPQVRFHFISKILFCFLFKLQCIFEHRFSGRI